MCVCVCVYVCVCVCVYTWSNFILHIYCNKYIQIRTHTNIHTHTQAYAYTDECVKCLLLMPILYDARVRECACVCVCILQTKRIGRFRHLSVNTRYRWSLFLIYGNRLKRKPPKKSTTKKWKKWELKVDNFKKNTLTHPHTHTRIYIYI